MQNDDEIVTTNYEYFYDRYTKLYTHTVLEDGELVTYRPQSVCSHEEIDTIMVNLIHSSREFNVANILDAMRERVGVPARWW